VQSLVRRWSALQPRERAIALLGTVGLVVAIAIAAVLERDTRVALFAAPLRPEQVTEVAGRLAQWNAPFVETADNVRVDAAKRNDLLLKLALVGIPHAHLESSADVLSKAGPLTPQSVLDAQATEGLAGDLAAGLRTIAGVQDAQVIIAPAVAGAFADETSHAATASVRLSLQPGAALTRDALEGVRAFVAAGVPGLDPKRVTILDDRGHALDGDGASGSDESRSLQQSLQSALDLALGAGTTIVRVRIDYDARAREVHDITRKPVGSRAIGTTTADERYKSASKQYAKTNASVDRGSTVEDERVETPAGRIDRISVAVAVDATRHLDLAKIRSLATATLGLISSRGDGVSVEEIAFPRAAMPTRNVRFSSAIGLIETLAPLVVFAVAFCIVAALAAKPVTRLAEAVVSRVAFERSTRATAAFAPAHVRGVLRNEPPHTAAAIISALPAATATAVLEMYPAEERAAIVRRMARGAAPVVPDYETMARRG
jgi:flagellar biosynthesis/type III secretory pathway M-ring protein FliF/YscJ